MDAKEIILITSQLVWLFVSIALLIYLKVFSRKSLADAPVRRSNLSLLTLAAVFLLYLGIVVLTSLGLSVFHQPPLLPPSSQSAPLTTTHAASNPATSPATTASSQAATDSDVPQSSAEELNLQLADAFTKIIPVAVILILVTRLVVGGLDGWGLSLRKLPAGFAYGLLGLFVIYPILIFINSIVAMILYLLANRHEEIHPTLQLLSRPDNTLWEKIVFILAAGLAAPFLEEVFFRGLMQTVFMENAWGSLPLETTKVQLQLYRPSVSHRWAAIVATSFIFAAVHLMPDAFAVLFVLALALGYVYERTGNLWACIFLHGIFNGINMGLFIFNK